VPRLAVIGFPVGHSRSPAMHNAALQALGLAPEWSYVAIEVEPQAFEALVRQLPAEGFVGANVTVPHKLAAFAIATTASRTASEIGAANTLSFESGGGIRADNTDAPGLVASLPEPPRGRRALVLGAGGAGMAAVWALGEAGAEVEIWNRTVARAEQVQIEVTQRAEQLQVEISVHTVQGDAQHGPGELDQGGYDLIVNTTTVGLQGEDPFESLPLRRDGFGPGQVVVDMVYGGGPSLLLAAAEAAGAAVVDGLEVLVQQGALSFEIWTGRAPDLDVMRAAARR
jgi:shikimate dehydrogenase